MAQTDKNNMPGVDSDGIDEVINLLKNLNDGLPEKEPKAAKKSNNISNEELQRELRNRFMSDEILIDDDESEDDYALDADFLREVNGEKHNKKSASKKESPHKVNDKFIEPVEKSEESEAVEEIEAVEEVEEIEAVEEVEEIEEIEEIEEVEEIEEIEEVEEAEENEENEFDESEFMSLSEILDLSALDGELCDDEDDEDGEFDQEPEMKTLDLDVLSETLETSLEEDVLELHNEARSVELESEECMCEARSELDNSVIELLLQLGCKDELEEEIGEDGIDEYYATRDSEPLEAGNSYAYDGEEYTSREQNDDIKARYKKAKKRSLITLLVSAAVTFFVFIYDTLPLFDVDLPWILNYDKNPIVYLLFGLQLSFVGCILPIKKLLHGLRGIVFARPDEYSAAAVSMLAVIFYDISLFFTKFDELPSTFHFIGSAALLFAILSDHLALCRERKTFSVYSKESDDYASYTLLRDSKSGSVADKMYRGGMAASQKVRVPAVVDIPTRYFHAVHEDRKISNFALRNFYTPAIILSVLTGVLCMNLDVSVSASLSAMWIILMFSMPMVYSLCDEIVLYIASYRLCKRGCAISGRASINKYSDTDIMVFNDTHLFSECDNEKIGISFYDKENALNVLGALDAFYSKIGGPMANVFNNIPNEVRCEDVTVLRAFKNGVEAIINKKHLLIVGDADFMERYGLGFEDNSRADSSRSTLFVSFDGKKSAKITVLYKIEPLFEILIERMAENGIYCAVETCDPLINGALVKRLRTLGNTPVSVVHKTARDIYRSGNSCDCRTEETGLIVNASRLKLAEAVIWCKRLRIIRKAISITSVVGGIVAFAFAVAFNILEMAQLTNQYLLLAFNALLIVGLLSFGIMKMPRKKYFSRSAIEKQKIKNERKD